MFLSGCDWVHLVLDLLKTSLLIFLVICKDCIDSETVVIIARAHLSQSKIVHSSRGYTFGMSIAGIRHVDSWGAFGMSIAGVRHVDSCGAVSPISIHTIVVFEHWANNGFYVIRSIAMVLFPEMLVQFGSFGMSLISFLVSRIFKFYVLNDQETNHLIVFSMLFVLPPGCIGSWGFVPAVLYSS